MQSADPAGLGFCPVMARGGRLVCQRCFGLTHYGHAREAVPALPAGAYERELRQIRRTPGVAVHVVSLPDLAGTLAAGQILPVIGDHASVLVANKLDLLPATARPDRMVRVLERIAAKARLSRLLGVHLVSAKTGRGVPELLQALTELGQSGRPIFCVGFANVGGSGWSAVGASVMAGKSLLINGLVKTAPRLALPQLEPSHYMDRCRA